MGRNKKPVGARLTDGSYDERIHGRPLATPAGMPRRPSWLDDDPVASNAWDETLAELSETQGLLAPVDAGQLALYCDAWSEYLECREILRREGRIVQGREGVRTRHPLCMVQRQALTTIAAIGARFGLTPTSRASLAIDAVSVVNGVRTRNHYADEDRELEDLLR